MWLERDLQIYCGKQPSQDKSMNEIILESSRFRELHSDLLQPCYDILRANTLFG